ncbi:MAG TPA: hypothetical protein VFH88_02510, partial [Candidatus Krumholzibacteria bacterium]|nr:hypothetical protein [Candidatus Krumholzibacteria bacterium]
MKKWFPTTQMHTIAPIVIKGKEFTVRELIQNAMKGERTKLAGHADANYLVSDHAAILWPDKKEVDTQVYRIYADSTGFTRRLLIAAKVEKFKKKDGEWVFEKNADSHDAGYRVSDFDESRFTDIPVYLKQDQEFDFQLLDRTLEKDRVVFHVRFTPKSDFSEMPGGEIWIDGNGFRVVHEIYEFNKNPFPILIKGIRRISVQWQELPGGEWVPRQVAAELDIRKGPFLPSGISFKQTWSDFRFDEGYKEYLFGKREGTPVAIAPKPAASPKVQTAPEAKRALGPPDTARVNTGVSAVVPESLYVYQAAPTDTSAADTTAASVGGGPALLAELQRQDNAAYSPEVEITNHAFIDSTAARHERLGIDAFKGSDIPLYGSHWELSFDPQVERWDYNRVEGLLFGGSAMFGRADKRSALSFFGGYATASRKFRYHTEFSTELPNADRKVSLKLSFRDYIDPFGSNRIPLNSLRAFVGGADDQDYLHRTGGGASLVYTPWEDVSFDAGFEGARERSTATNADFSFWGDLGRPNPVVDEGDEHAIVAGFELGGRRWLNAQITQRLAGGALGGDFR